MIVPLPLAERGADVAQASGATGTTSSPAALVVDLERTVLATNLFVECLFVLAKRRPWRLLMLPFWLLRGRAALKRALAREGAPDIATLPYRQEALARLARARQRGVPLVIVSSSDQLLVDAIARHLGLFSLVLASDGVHECSGRRRRDRIAAAVGAHALETAELAGSCVSPNKIIRLVSAMRVGLERRTALDRVVHAAGGRLSAYIAVLRPYQWAKNALVLVPLFAAHRAFDDLLLLHALVAFGSFSLCASAGYVLNDLLDLPSDRHHPRKKYRPLAAGQISPALTLALVPALLLAAAALALTLPHGFLQVLALYFVLTLGYSLRLKDIAILDVLTVAGLYAMRIWAGSSALAIPVSPWLLAFCIFIFLSLAMVKRYAELMAMRVVDGRNAHARAYVLEDSELLAALGGAAGYLSVLVLALYISGDVAHRLYSRHSLLWGECVLLLYWISYMWLMAHRARMDDDPLVFALKDRVSWVLVVLMGGLFVLALLPDGSLPFLPG